MKKLFIVCIGCAFANCLFAPTVYGMDIFEAVRTGNSERVKELIAADPEVINQYTPDMEAPLPLYKAILLNHAEIVRSLIDAGAKVDLPNNHGDTPLHIAVKKDSPTIVQMLIKANADVNLRDGWSQTPLAVSAERGRTEIVRLLIAAPHVQVDLAAHEGLAPLHFAVMEGHQDIVEILLASGAAIDIQDGGGATPLLRGLGRIQYIDGSMVRVFRTLAEKREAIEKIKAVVKFLVSAGAKVDLADCSGKTALQLAQKYDLQDIVQLIKNHLARKEMLVLLCARHPRLGADVNAVLQKLTVYDYQNIFRWLKKADR